MPNKQLIFIWRHDILSPTLSKRATENVHTEYIWLVNYQLLPIKFHLEEQLLIKTMHNVITLLQKCKYITNPDFIHLQLIMDVIVGVM